jgi:WD40 repeat protein
MARIATLFTMALLFASQAFSQMHGNRSHYAEYGPNGKYIALGGESLLLLNRKNKELRIINSYNPEARTLAFSQDGRYLAAESNNFEIYIYDLQDPTVPAVFFQGIKKKIGQQSRLKFSPDNTMLATSNSTNVVIYDIRNGSEGKTLLTIPNDSSNSNRSKAAFDISQDWKTLFHNMQAISLSTEKGKLSYKYGQKMNWNRTGPSLSAISADGTKVALVSRNGEEQRIYDLKTGDALLVNSKTRAYALATNKDFTKIYLNQIIWDIKNKQTQVIRQDRTFNKNTKTQISVAPDGEFMIGLYQYDNEASFKKSLQHSLTTFNRVSFKGDEVLFYRDYANGKRYDLHAANIPEALKGRSNRNLTNNNQLSSALASSNSGNYGINHLARIIRIDPVSVSSPLFRLSGGRGIAAHISYNNMVALVNSQKIYLANLSAGVNKLSESKVLKSISLRDRITSKSHVKINVSPDNRFVAVSYVTAKANNEFGQFDTIVKVYNVQGKLMKEIKTSDVNAILFSNDSKRFYYTSGKKVNCLAIEGSKNKEAWVIDGMHTFYTQSGKVLAIALSDDDTMMGYASSDGYNKVVRVSYGSGVITCIMQDTNRLKITKR